jgi:hypothetical protein
MIMESFAGLEHKYSYSMYGHSGAAVEVPLVLDGSPPRDREARLDVINRIYEHVSYVKSGDNTLASALAAVQQVTEQPGDDYFVFLLSDAMLEQYNVSPQNLADALLVDPRVNSYCIFIGEEDTAQRMGELMPPGRAHVCMDTTKLPVRPPTPACAHVEGQCAQCRLVSFQCVYVHVCACVSVSASVAVLVSWCMIWSADLQGNLCPLAQQWSREDVRARVTSRKQLLVMNIMAYIAQTVTRNECYD